MDESKLVVAGQIETDTGITCPVTVSSLTETHCQLVQPLTEADESLWLWLGAIGPLRAHVGKRSRTQLTFDGPIHPAIAAHFNALRT